MNNDLEEGVIGQKIDFTTCAGGRAVSQNVIKSYLQVGGGSVTAVAQK